MRLKYQLHFQIAYKEFLTNIKTNIVNDPNSFFDFVNSKRKTIGFPPVMKRNDEGSDDPYVM